ncbi:MAG: NADH:ubiquinone reductase (Na(+)-transporting) subunit C [Alistipes sp.]|nr:NADH:ubiquinone reductase (Na(+)-transporting) subunit C [Alistipes sp.]MBR4951726.1 NADH:ubiquinone reductase (Na(+)-transporting) subunit C [Alistipes sp.]
MAINKNSNAYIIIYTVVMVVIVGTLLAFLATSLKDKQAANVLNEKKVSIMKAFGSAEENFDDVVTMGYITDGKFAEVDKADAVAVDAVFAKLADLKGLVAAENDFPIFKYEKDGAVKYVAPMAGKGLWGDIWGYVSLNVVEGKVQISGIVMDHAGETPGLGAEIATETWQKKFEGKAIYDAEGKFAVRMQKGGAQNEHQVDAITGGTKTCDGVNAMLASSIGKYEAFLASLTTAVEAAPAEADESAEEVANVEPTKVEEE